MAVRRARVVIAVLAAFVALAAAPPAAVTLIRVGVLIDGTGGAARRDQAILVRGRRIESVGPAAAVTAPAGASVVDLSQATVLPGLIDAHTHIFLQGEDPAKGGYDIQLLSRSPSAPRARPSRCAAPWNRASPLCAMWKPKAQATATSASSRPSKGIHSGAAACSFRHARISTTGGYPLEGYAPEVEVPKGVQIVDGPVEARKAAREQLDHGADWIKVYMTHRSWVDKNGELVSQPTLTVEELRAIIDETHGWGKKVACHAYSGEGMQRALDGGCDSIEHGLVLTTPQIVQMIRQGTWYWFLP